MTCGEDVHGRRASSRASDSISAAIFQNGAAVRERLDERTGREVARLFAGEPRVPERLRGGDLDVDVLVVEGARERLRAAQVR